MPLQTRRFECKYPECAKDPFTYITIDIPEPDNSAGRPLKPQWVYCKREHRSIIHIPDTWDVVRPMAGEEVPSIDENSPPLEAEASTDSSQSPE
jgi:hypothetical protein